MLIKELFAKDINRPINGVVKVAQDDVESIRQELDEYVVTRELQHHFAAFFEAYCNAIDVPTDKIGVWISGFFGSGKSHFLKMLSYLLSNKEVAGKHAIDYFDGKLADPMVFSQMKRAATVPTEAILFNIDNKAGQWKEGDTAKTALLRAFARVFYEHRGFYGEDLKLARLEEYIDEQGKTEAFREAFARINGGDWVGDRDSYEFYEDDIAACLQEVLGMSPEAAQHWFDGTETAMISIDKLTDEIRQYVEQRAAQEGGKFRLLFMVDEVGQFIGSDVNLMLNLQTLVEELGSKCRGQVWIMVTSQEAIDEVTKGIAGNDFSKIQGRFTTRLSLSSSSADEVIKRRVLQKTDEAEALLKADYSDRVAVLKNLFTFEESRGDLVGYSSEDDFVESYPFVNYQFKMMPDVLAEIRKHGNAGKHLSGGERSMLSGFQEAAQGVEDRQSGALVPFWRFYDTIVSFLEHGIRQVVDRATRAAESDEGLLPDDVSVLKTLYLVRYIDYFRPTISNLSVLMSNEIETDKVALRESVQASLDRLVRENYVSRSGDAYHFLTDEEQDIARDIAQTAVDAAQIIDEVWGILYGKEGGIYPSPTFRRGNTDYPVDRYVDGQTRLQSGSGGMRLDIATAANELAKADDAEIALKSTRQALIVLPENGTYYEALEYAAKVNKYANTRNLNALNETARHIIEGKRDDAKQERSDARTRLSEALSRARVAVDGRMIDVRAKSPRQVIESALDELIGVVYTKADYIDTPAAGDEDILKILTGASQQLVMGGADGGVPNARAAGEVDQFLEIQRESHLPPVSLASLQERYKKDPFGWRAIDVAAVVAQLLADNRAEAKLQGRMLSLSSPEDRRQFFQSLRGHGPETLLIQKHVLPPDMLTAPAKELLRELVQSRAYGDSDQRLATLDVENADRLPESIKALMTIQQDQCRELLSGAYNQGVDCPYPYPGRKVVETGAELASSVLNAQNDDIALLTEFDTNKNDLLDWSEDMEMVRAFFPNQQRLFDESARLLALVKKEGSYLDGYPEVAKAVEDISAILVLPQPYRRIQELSALNSRIVSVHREVVQRRRAELLERIDEIQAQVRTYEGDAVRKHPVPGIEERCTSILSAMEQQAASKKSQVHTIETCTDLDALEAQLNRWGDQIIEKIEQACAPSQVDSSGTPEPPKPTVYKIDAKRLCPPQRFETEGEIDEYVTKIRSLLTEELQSHGSIRIG